MQVCVSDCRNYLPYIEYQSVIAGWPRQSRQGCLGAGSTRGLDSTGELDCWTIESVNSSLKCKAGFVESFGWSEIVESLSRAIVESLGHVCKGVVRDVAEVGLLRKY